MGVGISLSGLASAVANEGGIGVISAAGLGLLYKKLSPNYTEAGTLGLAAEIRKAREKAKGIIGVNVMVALSDFAELVKTSIAEKGRHHFQRCRTTFGPAVFPEERQRDEARPHRFQYTCRPHHLRKMEKQLRLPSRCRCAGRAKSRRPFRIQGEPAGRRAFFTRRTAASGSERSFPLRRKNITRESR